MSRPSHQSRPNRPEDLGDFFHRRWTVPILGELHRRGGGAKQVTLRRTLGVSRDSLRRTLEPLVEWGIVRPNPGYGHPLRPEILLADEGAHLAARCSRLVESVEAVGVEEIAWRKWSLPVVRSLDDGTGRFGELRRDLEGITPRALTLALESLQSVCLVEREVEPCRPPRSRYLLTNRAEPLVVPLRRIEAALVG